MTIASCVVGLIDCNAYSHDESPRKKLNEFAVPLFANLSGSIVPATILEASIFVDVNCVQFAAVDAEVLITLERSIILLRLKVPDVVAEVVAVTEYWFELIRDIV